MVTTKEVDGVQFDALTPDDVGRLSVVAQTLDNQWVPRQLLTRMISERKSLADVERTRKGHVRGEYVRALVNARQVVANRAYLYNNPTVFSDFVRPGDDRVAFEGLLHSGVIVPFLFDEESPIAEPEFAFDPRGFAAWQEVVKSAQAKCLRLSWDEDENKKMIRAQLSQRFHAAAQAAVTGDPAVLAHDLGLPSESSGALRARLGDLADLSTDVAVQGRLATRDELYRMFVVADDTAPTDGKYDGSKPFAAEIKQLLDLSYNVNLPDATGGYALTPIDSLPRTALQEWHALEKKPEVTADDLLQQLRRTAFDLVQSGLYVKSFAALRLSDVPEIRLTDEWSRYVMSLDGLLRDPLSFSDPDAGVARIYHDYAELAGVATRIGAQRRSSKLTAQWTPVVEIVVEAAGATLSIVWGQETIYKIAGAISAAVSSKAIPVVARLIVRGLTSHRSKADLSVSLEFMDGRLQGGREQWDTLVAKVKETPGWREARAELKGRREATLNHPEEAYA